MLIISNQVGKGSKFVQAGRLRDTYQYKKPLNLRFKGSLFYSNLIYSSYIKENVPYSSFATQTKKQALDFIDWAVNNRLYALQKYPQMYRPFDLIIIDRETSLTSIQVQYLKPENEPTQGIVKLRGLILPSYIYAVRILQATSLR